MLVDQDVNKVELADVDENVEFEGMFDDLPSYNRATIPRSQQAHFLDEALFTPTALTYSDVEQITPATVDSEDVAQDEDSRSEA